MLLLFPGYWRANISGCASPGSGWDPGHDIPRVLAFTVGGHHAHPSLSGVQWHYKRWHEQYDVNSCLQVTNEFLLFIFYLNIQLKQALCNYRAHFAWASFPVWSHPADLACSRLRDGGGKSFSNKKYEKRARAGERQGFDSRIQTWQKWAEEGR